MLSSYQKVYGYSRSLCLLVIMLTFTPSQATADEVRPSFNCKKAVQPSEKAICSVPSLARMDAKLGAAWTAMISAFTTSDFKKAMKREQLDWLKRREACGGDIECLNHTYEDRLQGLEGSTAKRFNGSWHADSGADILIYESKTGKFFVAIHANDPQAGAWTCDVEGSASVEGDRMTVSSQGKVITITFLSNGQLSIPPSDQNFDSNEHFCGLNGGFTFDYAHVVLK